MTIKRVLIVDDSAVMRELLSGIVADIPGFAVAGTAADPLIAREKIKALNPDIVTLDIEMPRMDGLSFLERIMALRPMPVIVISSLTQKGTDAALRALSLGAVDFVAKPAGTLMDTMAGLKAELGDKLRAAASAAVQGQRRVAEPSAAPAAASATSASAKRIVAVGASTGGVEALQRLLSGLPADAPAIVVTQHMPPGFTASFARRLDTVCRMTVQEAQDQQRVLRGNVYIANGQEHLGLVRQGAEFRTRSRAGPRVSGHCPSVDVMFASVAEAAGGNAMGIILTGMGRDGAEGLLQMRQAGARTFGESEASCLIYGMPRAAMEIGAVEAEMDIAGLAAAILG